jgi:MFS family permease
MILVLFCLASIWSNILSFNFALICFLKPNQSDPTTHHDVTSPDRAATQFTPYQKSFLTSAVAFSALIAHFIVVNLVNRFGIRTIFTFAGFCSATGTLLLPTAIYNGFYYTIFCRILQGIGFAANFPAIGAFTGKWTYYKQSGLFTSVLVAYVQLSPAVTMPISGALCESSWKWPSVFYCHGVVCIILFTLYGALYRNTPKKHPLVGDIEVNKLAVGKSSLNKEQLRKIPYFDILKTASVWAVWIAALGNFTAVNLMFLYSPVFVLAYSYYTLNISDLYVKVRKMLDLENHFKEFSAFQFIAQECRQPSPL